MACEKAALPLFLEHPGKVQRGQRIKLAKEETGADRRCLAHLPVLRLEGESGEGFPGYNHTPEKHSVFSKLFPSLQLASSY